MCHDEENIAILNEHRISTSALSSYIGAWGKSIIRNTDSSLEPHSTEKYK